MDSSEFSLVEGSDVQALPILKAPGDPLPEPVKDISIINEVKKQETPKKKSRAQVWQPTEDHYVLIRNLAELGWPSIRICEALNITPQQFANAIAENPRIKEEYELGVANCKAWPDKMLAWRPTPKDLALVEHYASQGLREAEIAAKLKIGRAAFMRRMEDTPQVRQAYELGEGQYRADLIEDSQKLLDERSSDLKFVSSLLIFKLKAHCGLTEKAESKPVMVEGKIEHKVTLNAPQPVAIQDISEFAKIEMERANKLSAEKLKVAGITQAIEAEVIDG